MKKYLVLIVLSLFAFTSCVDDDDFVRDPDLIGKWYVYSKRKLNVSIPVIFPHCKEKPTYLEFKETGALEQNEYSVTCEYIKTTHMKYRLDKHILTMIIKMESGDDLEVPYDYKIDGEKLILTSKEEKPEYRIESVCKKMK